MADGGGGGAGAGVPVAAAGPSPLGQTFTAKFASKEQMQAFFSRVGPTTYFPALAFQTSVVGNAIINYPVVSRRSVAEGYNDTIMGGISFDVMRGDQKVRFDCGVQFKTPAPYQLARGADPLTALGKFEFHMYHIWGYIPIYPGTPIVAADAGLQAVLAAEGFATYDALYARLVAKTTELFTAGAAGLQVQWTGLQIGPTCVMQLAAAQAAAAREIYKLSSEDELGEQLQDQMRLAGAEFDKEYIILNDNLTSLYNYADINAWFQVKCEDPKTRQPVTKAEKIVFRSACGFHQADTNAPLVITVRKTMPIYSKPSFGQEPFTYQPYTYETEYYLVNDSRASIYDKASFRAYIKTVKFCKDFMTGTPIKSLRRVVFRKEP